MDRTKLKQVLDAHLKWLLCENGGKRADLRGAVLTDTDLTRADLTDALLTDTDLTRADLRGAVLRGADLTDADLTRADLTDALLTDTDLTRADLTDAVLTDTDLTRADLRGAVLRGADLTDADLTRADLRGAVLTDTDLTRADLTDAVLTDTDLTRAVLTDANIYYPMSCPSEGAFVAFKKALNMDDYTSCIVKLMIYDDAKRSSATGRKCRCDKAKVLEIYDMSGNTISANVCSMRDKGFRYVVGETVTVPNFDENRWNECSTGIHFFITREEAERYNG